MTGKVWLIEKTDGDGIVVFEGYPDEYSTFRDTEAEAVDYGISCAEDRRESIASSLRTLKARRRALIRKNRK